MVDTGDIPSIYPFGTEYDRDLSRDNPHNVEAARRMGLKYDSKKEAFVDCGGCPVRDKFFQPL